MEGDAGISFDYFARHDQFKIELSWPAYLPVGSGGVGGGSGGGGVDRYLCRFGGVVEYRAVVSRLAREISEPAQPRIPMLSGVALQPAA